MTGGAAVVLLSGGLDSATVLAIARKQGFACHALSFDYGQRHDAELRAAEAVARQLGVASHQFVTIDTARFIGFKGSALTDSVDVPKDREESAMAADIPVTYVPARNTIFLSYALALAEVLKSSDIFIGVNAVDYSGYPDCRPEYIQAYEQMGRLATKAGVTGTPLSIHAPLIDMTKKQIIEQGLALGVDYSLTHSCYDPIEDSSRAIGYKACGHCDSCLLRQHAFESLGQSDPVLTD